MTLVLPDELDSRLEGVGQLAHFAAVLRNLPSLKKIASELFSEDISIDIESDREIEDMHHLVFHVLCTGDARSAADRRLEWLRRTTELLGVECDKVRLSITVREDDGE